MSNDSKGFLSGVAEMQHELRVANDTIVELTDERDRAEAKAAGLESAIESYIARGKADYETIQMVVKQNNTLKSENVWDKAEIERLKRERDEAEADNDRLRNAIGQIAELAALTKDGL